MKKLLLALFLIPSLALAQSSSVYEIAQAKPTDDIYGTLGACLGATNTENLVCTANGLKVDVAASSGQYAEDVAETAGAILNMSGTVRRDTPASSAGTAGDNATLNTDSQGRLWTRTDLATSEDEAHTDGDTGVTAITRRSDTPASSAGTTGDNATLNTTSLGALWTDNIAHTVRVCVAITPDNDAAYTPQDVVATEDSADPLAFANVVRTGVLSGTITGVEVTNTEADAIGWKLCLFSADPSASTTTDGAAMAVAAADLSKWLGCVPVTASDVATTENYSTTGMLKQIVLSSTTLYAALITPGAPQWAAEQTVNVCVTAAQD